MQNNSFVRALANNVRQNTRPNSLSCWFSVCRRALFPRGATRRPQEMACALLAVRSACAPQTRQRLCAAGDTHSLIAICSVTPGLRHTSLKVPSSASLIDARIALTYMTPSLAPALHLLLTLVVLVTRSSISWFRSSMSAGNPVETRHIAAGAWRPRFPSAPRAPRLHGA